MKQIRFIGTLIAGMALIIAAFVVLIPKAHASATINVTTINDVVNQNDGQCSLREAIIAANTNTISGIVLGECPAGQDDALDIIKLESGETYNLTILGAGEDAAETGDLDILDNTASLDLHVTTSGDNQATIDGQGSDRIFHVFDARVSITNITMRSGGSVTAGGGIYNGSGQVQLNSSAIILSQAALGGGAVLNAGTAAQFIMEASEISRNEATAGSGGGISNSEGQVFVKNSSAIVGNTAAVQGGGIHNTVDGRVIVEESAISDNRADMNGGGISSENGAITVTLAIVGGNNAPSGTGAGIYAYESDLHIASSAVVDNTGDTVAGGIWTDSVATIANSTISGNEAVQGAGLYVESTGTVTLTHVTNAANNGKDGAAIYSAGAVTLQGTILAGHGQGNCVAVATPFNSLGHNLVDDDTCPGLTAVGDITGIDALLGPQQNNGGPTPTLALLPGSPAINAADDEVCAAAPIDNVDQRGVERPQFGGCDIGAYEFVPLSVYLPFLTR